MKAAEGVGMTALSQILPEDSAGSPFRSVLSGERQGVNSLGFHESEEVEVGASFSWCPSPPAPKELTQSSGGGHGWAQCRNPGEALGIEPASSY